jgi:hypothetical protein
MSSQRFGITAWCGLLVAAQASWGAAPATPATTTSAAAKPAVATSKPAARAATPAYTTMDIQVLASRIDQLLSTRMAAAKVVPAPPADDAEFMRRVYLDLAGRIPSVAEARRFLDDKTADKRERLVERLLSGPAYVNHFANVWKGLLLPESVTDFTLQYYFMPSFESWVRKQIADNVRYDKMVHDLLTAPAGFDQGRLFGPDGPSGDPAPTAFYLAKETKPENLGASTAKLFLGVRLECAQCHNHPFARWTREQFWEYAAFFAGFQKQGEGIFNPVREFNDRRELAISGGNQIVQATFLDGTEPQWKYKVSPRVTLANWMTSPKNRYFTRAIANRTWTYFFGLGIVEPVDDMSDDHPPSHPELLDELARQFADHGFDFKFLIRAITSSQAYQRTSTVAHPSQNEPRLFARMAVKGLSPEQLFESIAQATGYPNGGRDLNPFIFGVQNPRSEFMASFTNQDKRTEFQTSILQALKLMNGNLVADATSLGRSTTMAAVADAPFLDTSQKLETLFLATLSRRPSPEEAARFSKYIDKGGPKTKPKEALCDVFWALINSSEFLLNH